MSTDAMTRIRGMLGFAMRAGRIVLGTELILGAMARGKAAPKLVIISEEASAPTREKLIKKGKFYGIETIELNIDMGELGRILGKEYAPAAVAVTDAGFAAEITKAYEALRQQ